MRQKIVYTPLWLFLLLFLVNIHIVKAQSVAWTNTYNGTIENEDRLNAAVTDGSGNVFATGYTYGTSGTDRNVLVVKYSTAGALLWQQTYTSGSDNADEGNAIALDASGNVYVAGNINRDALMLKLNANGDTLWARRYNGTGSGTDEASALVIDAAGNPTLCGRTDVDPSITTSDYNYLVLKYNAAGVQQWVQTYGGSGNGDDDAHSIAADASNNIYVTGEAANTLDLDIVTIKYNAAGAQQYLKLLNSGNGDEVGADIDLVGSNFYIAAEYASTATNDDYLTVKYDLAGNVVWSKVFDGGEDDRASEVKADANGNVYVSGRSEDANGIYNIVTLKYNAVGTQQWLNSYDNAGKEDRPYDLTADNSGNAYVAGESSTYTPTDTIGDVIALKINAGGATQVWARLFADTGGGDDGARAVALDANNNVYVVGYGYTNATQQGNGLLLKYNAAGTQQWVARYNGTGDNTDKYRRAVTDAAGNLYTTGYGFDTNQGRNIITAKYNADGTLAWQQTYNSVLNNDQNDEGEALCLDPAGNVYVTGIADNNLVAIKYSAAGAQLWTQTYNNAADESDEGIGCYADATNLYVTGRTDIDPSSATNYDIITIRYNSSNGNQQWLQTYNGSANSNDRPEAMTGDANSIYITGRATVGTTENMLTLKYALLGTLTWAMDYGSATGNDRGEAITLRGNNVIVGGRTSSDGLTDDAVVVRYSGSGAQQWAQVYSAAGNDRIYDIATDSLGYIYAAGQTNNGSGDDVLLLKYNATGSQQWLSTYDSGSGFDQANAVAVDCAGNVWVAGRRATNGNDLLTIKYDGKTGNQLWLDAYNQAALNDEAADLVIYSNLNTNSIYVVGNTQNTANQEDALARKYTETIPNLVVSPANPTVCLGQPITLSVSGATLGSFRWKDGNTIIGTDTLVTVTPTTAGTKTYTLLWNSGSCSTSIPINVTVQDAPVPIINGTPNVCQSNTYTYSVASPVIGSTYTWSIGGGGSFVGSNIGTSVTVQWNSGTNSTVTVVVN